MQAKPKSLFAVCAAVIALWTAATQAETAIQPREPSRPVDLVIALDVSGSMSGLIESAKQRLWDIVNELAQARPQPDLRIAIITYGSPAYGAQSGYVRIDTPFTRDLDAVQQTLFSFGTSGGDEYVARAVHTAVNDLAWSSDPKAMKVLFVAGNEPANQDPLISVVAATRGASARRIVVNTIYCGNKQDGDAAGWRDVATQTNGLFASIDQNAAAVANIATPMDAELARLNQALSETYVAYGAGGGRFKENQVAQDENAAGLSLPSVASRAVAKAGELYRNEGWDLVDAQKSGVAVEAMAPETLPEPMRSMSTEERKQYVAELAHKREAIGAEIGALGKERQDFIAAERDRLAKDGESGLDEAIVEGLRELAGRQGFELATGR
jgi:Mg-chelatase subunit ChlD